MANILNYEILLGGSEHIQKLLEVEHLSPQEALSVAHFSMDILIAHKIEGITPQDHIKKCLVDYVRFFSGEEQAANLIALMKNGQDVREVEDFPPLDLINRSQREIEYLLKKVILSGWPILKNPTKELLTVTVLSLSKCKFELAFFCLFILEKIKIQGFLFSEHESQALQQARKYLFLCLDCTESKKSKWWKKILEYHVENKYGQ